MGRTAKVCKRSKKPASASTQKTAAAAAAAASDPSPARKEHAQKQAAAASAAKKASLKDKAAAKTRKPGARGHVLGGADYVDIMMGGRRKAREEATKLPPPEK